jgi:hypothetical protein
MNGVNFDSNPAEIISVKRDSSMHSWAIAVGDHWVALPMEGNSGRGQCGVVGKGANRWGGAGAR